MVCEPSASDVSDVNVSKPIARPPAATNNCGVAAIAVEVPLMTLADRTLPAAANWLTVKVKVPPNVPVPAVTVATFGFDVVAASARQSAGCESASAVVVSAVRSLRINPYACNAICAICPCALIGFSSARSASTSAWMIAFVSSPVARPPIDCVPAPLAVWVRLVVLLGSDDELDDDVEVVVDVGVVVGVVLPIDEVTLGYSAFETALAATTNGTLGSVVPARGWERRCSHHLVRSSADWP